MNTKVIIPLIRQTFPNVIAQQIVGVQPMTGIGGTSSYFDVKYHYHKHPRYKFSRKWFVGEIAHNNVYPLVDIENWCKDNFGLQPINPDAWCRWYRYSTRKFYFRDEKDYVLFTMRWS